MQRTFGPAAIERKGEPIKVACHTSSTYCFLLHSSASGYICSDQKPSREVPDPRNTPDWCKYRVQALQDAQDMIETEALGLNRLDRAQLSARLKDMPKEARGTDHKGTIWRLTEMNAGMMRYALLKAHRAGLA